MKPHFYSKRWFVLVLMFSLGGCLSTKRNEVALLESKLVERELPVVQPNLSPLRPTAILFGGTQISGDASHNARVQAHVQYLLGSVPQHTGQTVGLKPSLPIINTGPVVSMGAGENSAWYNQARIMHGAVSGSFPDRLTLWLDTSGPNDQANLSSFCQNFLNFSVAQCGNMGILNGGYNQRVAYGELMLFLFNHELLSIHSYRNAQGRGTVSAGSLDFLSSQLALYRSQKGLNQFKVILLSQLNPFNSNPVEFDTSMYNQFVALAQQYPELVLVITGDGQGPRAQTACLTLPNQSGAPSRGGVRIINPPALAYEDESRMDPSTAVRTSKYFGHMNLYLHPESADYTFYQDVNRGGEFNATAGEPIIRWTDNFQLSAPCTP